MPATLARMLTAGAAWIAGAVVSVAVGLGAQSMIGDRFGTSPVYPVTAGDPPKATVVSSSPTPSSPRTRSARTRSPAAAVPTPARSSERASSANRVIDSAGGTAVARCGGQGAYLVSWSPQPGYDAWGIQRGPGPVVAVTFASARRAIHVTVRCVDGEPVPQLRILPGPMPEPTGRRPDGDARAPMGTPPP